MKIPGKYHEQNDPTPISLPEPSILTSIIYHDHILLYYKAISLNVTDLLFLYHSYIFCFHPGRKSGKGFYVYPVGKGKKTVRTS